jgi:3-methyladenine DNA glycosylase/8-oxoguanine DNA glycosylase
MPLFDREEAAQHLMASDQRLERLIPLVGPFTLKPLKGTVFQGLLKSIVHQQLAGKAAQTIHGRVLALLPQPAEEQPAALLALGDAALRSAGLSRSKVLSVRDLAQRTVSGQIPPRRQLSRLADDEVIEVLAQTRGVGRWTAEMILIFWLGRPDVLPVHDLGVRKGYALAYRKRELPTPVELERRGERWRPYRSVAAWYFWRAVDLASRNGSENLW